MMALEYDLELITNLKPQEILSLLVSKLELRWGDETCVNGQGLNAGATVMSKRDQEISEANYKFRPSLYIWFRLDKFDKYDAGYSNMMKATAVLLKNVSGNMILLFNGETPILKRIDGRIIFNSRWSEAAPKELDLPHELQLL